MNEMPGGTGYIRAVQLSSQHRKAYCTRLYEATGVPWVSFSQNELVRFEAMDFIANVQSHLFEYYPDHSMILAVMVVSGVDEKTGLRATIALFRRGYATQLLGRSQHQCVVSPCPHHLLPFLLEGGPPAGVDVHPVFQPVFDGKSILAVHYGPGATQKSYKAALQRSLAISDGVNHASRCAIHIANRLGCAPPPVCVVHGGAICAQLWPRYRPRPTTTLLVSPSATTDRRGLFRLSTENSQSIYASAPDADAVISEWHHGVPSYTSEFFYVPPLSTGVKARFELTPGKVAEVHEGKLVRKLLFETSALTVSEDILNDIKSFVTAGSQE